MADHVDLVLVSRSDMGEEVRYAYRKLGRDILNAPGVWTRDRRSLVMVPRAFAKEHGLEVWVR